jgi:hypothetical protein
MGTEGSNPSLSATKNHYSFDLEQEYEGMASATPTSTPNGFRVAGVPFCLSTSLASFRGSATPCGKAQDIRYALNHWSGLVPSISDARPPLRIPVELVRAAVRAPRPDGISSSMRF